MKIDSVRIADSNNASTTTTKQNLDILQRVWHLKYYYRAIISAIDLLLQHHGYYNEISNLEENSLSCCWSFPSNSVRLNR